MKTAREIIAEIGWPKVGDTYYTVKNENFCFQPEECVWEGSEWERHLLLDDIVFRTLKEAVRCQRQMLKLAGFDRKEIPALLAKFCCG